MVAVINCLTFIFAGFAVFSRLGHTAFVTNKDVGVVTSSGAGFAFVAYPDGISRLPASPVLAFLLFFALLTLGIDSQLSMMETVISAVPDGFPTLLIRKNTPFILLICCIGFLLGVPLCTEGGRRVVTLMNDYTGSNNMMIIALFEIIALCYVYNIKGFRADVEMVITTKANVWCGYWLLGCWFLTEQNSVRDRGCCALGRGRRQISGGEADGHLGESWPRGAQR